MTHSPNKRHLPPAMSAAEYEARIAELREVCDDAVSGLRYIELIHGRLHGVGWDRVFDAYAALPVKPKPKTPGDHMSDGADRLRWLTECEEQGRPLGEWEQVKREVSS